MRRRILLVLPGLCLFVSLWGQEAGLRSWSVADGLAQSQVYCMLEDSRGFLWLGTQGGGLSRFDGIRFANFQQRDGLVNDYILSLTETGDGRIWVGTRNGISVLDGYNRISSVQFPGSEAASVNDLHCDPFGRLWAATSLGLFRIWGDSAVRQPLSLSNLTRVRVDSTGIWVGTSVEGLFRIEGDNMHFNGPVSALHGAHITDLETGPEGNLWAGTYDRGVYVRKNGVWQRFLPGDNFPRALVFDLAFEGKDKLWIATQSGGVWRWSFPDSSSAHFTEEEGLGDDHVRSLLVDSWANVWLGTSGGGITRFRGQPFAHYGRRKGLPEQVYAIAEDADCQLWLGNADQGVAVLRADTVSYVRDERIRSTKVKALYAAKAGQVWIGTEGKGLALYRDSSFQWFTNQTGLGGNWVRAIVSDREGNIFVGKAGGGLSVLRPAKADTTGKQYYIHRFRRGDYAWADRINTLVFDRQERLWLGTYARGIGFLTADSSLEQVPIPGGPPCQLVRTLIQGPRGKLWAGTAGGILQISPETRDSGRVQLFRDALLSGNVYSLVFDEEGNLWAGTESGLDRISLNAAGDPIETVHFSAADGFTGIENCQGAALRDRFGTLWFGTINGLASYTPGVILQNSVPPKVSLTGVQVFYAPLEDTRYADFRHRKTGISQNLELAPGDNHLSFSFTGINLRNPEAVQYSWRLLGAERNWSPPSDRTQATYSQVAPGSYRFQVRAANEDGVWSPVLSTPPFVIRPPLIRQSWFQLLLAGGVILLVSLLLLAYIRRVRARARSAHERLELEKRLLELEQKALQLQMNPHFIFHALNGIQGLIQQEDPQTARRHLGRFSALMRRVLQHARQGTISLEEEIQALEDYLALEYMSRGESFDYAISVDESLEVDFLEIPPMLLQPLVENALIHGLAGLDRRGRIDIRFDLPEESLLRVSIRDNGRGRKAAGEAKGRDGHVSTALAVTRERLAALGPEASLTFIDLEEQGQATGTEVRVQIPV